MELPASPPIRIAVPLPVSAILKLAELSLLKVDDFRTSSAAVGAAAVPMPTFPPVKYELPAAFDWTNPFQAPVLSHSATPLALFQETTPDPLAAPVSEYQVAPSPASCRSAL